MNPKRINLLKAQPELATMEEITELADMAGLGERCRHAVFEILVIVNPLVTPGGVGASRGGAIERIKQAADKAFEEPWCEPIRCA